MTLWPGSTSNYTTGFSQNEKLANSVFRGWDALNPLDPPNDISIFSVKEESNFNARTELYTISSYCSGGLFPLHNVGDRAICALSVGFHVQRLGYIKSRSHSLYRYVFDAGPNKYDILLG